MPQDFVPCRMEYGKDEQGKEILLKDGKFQVMMQWEKPYMHACIDALKPFGDVLEIGFGLAYSAERIQAYHPKSHTIIEYHPLVAERARQWASAYPNVTIIEDTWQNALPKLGTFDCIFFDDYPLHSEQQIEEMQGESHTSHLLVQQGNQMIEEIEKNIPFLKEIKYSNEDLADWLKQIPLEQKEIAFQGARFLSELLERGQITKEQWEHFVASLQLSKEEIPQLSKPKIRPKDRLLQFLSQCLQSHMRKGSRFSCFLSSPASKYQDDAFVEEIIANPNLDYHEEEIALEVPSNCAYFSGDKALVMTITLQG